MVFYAIGVVSHHLISFNKDEVSEQQNLYKLIGILQGGI